MRTSESIVTVVLQLNPNLDTDSVVVLGQGNVAIDVARILLTPVDILRVRQTFDYGTSVLFIIEFFVDCVVYFIV